MPQHDRPAPSLEQFAALAARERGLAVMSVARPDGTVASSVVNAGVLAHPLTGQPCVGMVARGDARRLDYLRASSRATLVLRSGWQWAAAEGSAELAGPQDALDGIDPERLRLLLREIFTAAGGEHDNWAEYDEVMAREQRTAVLITPDRAYSNPR